jgi:KDO2-lipid IV(A) lauroyltransferase
VRLVPHRVAYGVGGALAVGLLRLQPRRFDGLRDNLRRVLADPDRRTLQRTLRDNVRNLARSWIDVMEMAHRPEEATARVQPVALENLLKPLERGRGVVTVSLHLGSWELALATWNHRFGSMAMLAESLQPAELFERVVAARNRMGVKVIPIDIAAIRSGDAATARRLGASALRDVYRVLRNNGIVAMAVDRDLIGNGEMLPFFGEPASIPTGVVEVAMRTGAAIVPVFSVRTGKHGDQMLAGCYPEIVYDSAAPRQEEMRRVVGELLTVIEGVIRAHAEQWHVMDPIWPAEVGTAP